VHGTAQKVAQELPEGSQMFLTVQIMPSIEKTTKRVRELNADDLTYAQIAYAF